MNIIEVFNSFTVFMVLAAIAFGIMFLVIKKDSRPSPKSTKR